MSDLTERLREHNWIIGCDCFSLVEEAANRIEHLETAEFIGRLPDYVKELEAENARLTSRNDELVDALAPMIERCRHDIGVDRCHQPAVVIVWGKLAKPDEFGPKCIDHVPEWWDGTRPDQYAVVDLRPALRALRSES